MSHTGETPENDLLLEQALTTTRPFLQSPSQQYLNSLVLSTVSPSQSKETKTPFRIENPGIIDLIGPNLASQQPLPSIHPTSIRFIPLDLAIRHVKRLESDFKRYTQKYRENLAEMRSKYEDLQKEMRRTDTFHSKIKAEVEKNNSFYDKMKSEFDAYRTSAETILNHLKTKVVSLNSQNEFMRKSLELEEIMRKNQEKDIIELEIENMTLKIAAENEKIAGPVYFLMQKYEATRREIQKIRQNKGKISTDLNSWMDHFETTHRKTPSKSDFGPVAHLKLQETAMSDKLQDFNQKIAQIRGELEGFGFYLSDEDALNREIAEKKELQRKLDRLADLSFDLEQVTEERNALEKELKELKRMMAAPARDDPELTMLRNQLEYATSELQTSRAKAIALDVENRHLRDKVQLPDSKHNGSFRSEQLTPHRIHT